MGQLDYAAGREDGHSDPKCWSEIIYMPSLIPVEAWKGGVDLNR